ncbi:MAG: DUF1015 family protein, partial [Actinobacteria bacterium]|nr:DUF1015 family protein [Actinomycetota bacterium]
MPDFISFRGLRYSEGPDISALIAPPYDVVDETTRKELESRSPHNAVRIEVPQEHGTTDRYASARCLLDEWTSQGVLRSDGAPTLTACRMRYTDESGRSRQTLGVLGALEIADGALLPHEHTTPKAKDDRLNLLRTCRTNVSPIWGLAPTPGLTDLLESAGPATAVATDDDGVVHECWTVSDEDQIAAVRHHLAGSPVIVADGHHRYEVARAFREERRAATGDGPGDYD